MQKRIDERRVLKRRHLVFYLDVIDRDSGKVIGQLGDISTEGLLVISREQLPADMFCHGRLVLPDVRGFRSGFLDLDIRCCWQSPDVNPDLYCSGFSFENLGDADRGTINSLIQALGFRD